MDRPEASTSTEFQSVVDGSDRTSQRVTVESGSTVVASTVTDVGSSAPFIPVPTVTGYPKFGKRPQSDETGTWYNFWTGGEVDEFFKIDRVSASPHALMTVREGFILRMSTARLEKDWMESAEAVGERMFVKSGTKTFYASGLRRLLLREDQRSKC